MIEAGRAGLPIIASNIAPHCEILDTTEGSEGRRVYDVGDTDSLASIFSIMEGNLPDEIFGAKLLASELDERYAPARTAEVHERAYQMAVSHRHRR